MRARCGGRQGGGSKPGRQGAQNRESEPEKRGQIGRDGKHDGDHGGCRIRFQGAALGQQADAAG
eukprot:421121-Prymnesium_polylepis.1